MKFSRLLHELFLPKFGKMYLLRVICVAILAFLFFKFICKPMILNGGSMEPNYHTGTLNFCWTPTFWFREPQRGDVVSLKYAGDRVMLLKRIVAVAGDTVEFRNGILFVNDKEVEEPYILFERAPWNLPKRKVSVGHVYVVGDNRSMPMYQHKFGQISANRVKGTLLL